MKSLLYNYFTIPLTEHYIARRTPYIIQIIYIDSNIIFTTIIYLRCETECKSTMFHVRCTMYYNTIDQVRSIMKKIPYETLDITVHLKNSYNIYYDSFHFRLQRICCSADVKPIGLYNINILGEIDYLLKSIILDFMNTIIEFVLENHFLPL